MKLSNLVFWRISLALIVILTVWAGLFYMAIMEEVNDEVDDSLIDYAEQLIIRTLSGEEMPVSGNGTNNQYYLYEVSASYAHAHPQISYRDEMVYITEKKEEEPARVLITIFPTDDNRYMELVVYMPTIEKFDLQKAILGWIVFLYALLLLVILFITMWVYRRNMKPLYVLLKWLDTYRLGYKNEPLFNATKVTEFQHLNEVVMASVVRNEQLYEQQKLFIGNASHEMQTPLAICQNRLEMLMEDAGFSEKQLDELFKIYRTLENLTRMNRSLLLLCKIENGQFIHTQTICLNALLDTYLSDYEEVYAYRGIDLSVNVEGNFYVEMNDSLASILITNLLKNAFVHNVDKGDIMIRITDIAFSIGNTGTEELDKNHLFERFYQRHTKEGSTGLGLALVDSVCKVSKLYVRYEFKDKMHWFILTKN